METLIFPFLLLLLSSLCLWAIIGSKGWWAHKFWLINLCAMFFFIFWVSIQSFLGWPNPYNLPAQFKLISYHADEPKSLYVVAEQPLDKDWYIKKLFEYKSPDNIRMYKFPYSQKMHENLEKAMERVSKGSYVIMSKDRIMDAEEMKQFTRVQNLIDGLADLNSPNPTDAYNFYIMPPSKLIKKPEP